MLYFAYGSNMLERRLQAADRAPSARAVAPGRVEGWRLAFDKVGRDGSGKCTLEPAAGEVWGVLFEIAAADRPRLDRAEGLGAGYREERLVIAAPGGVREAFAYVATVRDPALRPYHWYKALVVAGAVEYGLPAGYVARIRAVPSIADPDAARRAIHEALLTPPGTA